MVQNNWQILASGWFESAKRALEDGFLLEKTGGHSETICFQCHQAVEKYLKGFIVFNGTDIKDDFMIHNLPRLLDYCVKFDASLEELRVYCIALNKYYIESRYPPDAPKDYPKEEVKQALQSAKEIEVKISDIFESSV